jgi:hypothetical protein
MKTSRRELLLCEFRDKDKRKYRLIIRAMTLLQFLFLKVGIF